MYRMGNVATRTTQKWNITLKESLKNKIKNTKSLYQCSELKDLKKLLFFHLFSSRCLINAGTDVDETVFLNINRCLRNKTKVKIETNRTLRTKVP